MTSYDLIHFFFLERKWLVEAKCYFKHSFTLKNRLNGTFITCWPLVSFMINFCVSLKK